ncbi:MAG TPA: ABC transporter permease [Vicinamibacterales bacterium]
MGAVAKLVRRLTYWLHGRRTADELAEELEFHRASRQAAFERSGLNPEEARAASRRALGNVALAREDSRAVWSWTPLDRLRGDLRYAVRSLRKQPTFGLVAIVTLAAGICATTISFSVVEAELWKPLPFPDPDRLVGVSPREGAQADTQLSTDAEFAEWRSQTDVFEDVAAFEWSAGRVLRAHGMPESVQVRPVTTNFFDVLGRKPAIGRGFTPVDAAPSAVAILSDAGWRRLFNADPRVVGSVVSLDDRPYTIVGVSASDRLEFLNDPDLFTVLDARPALLTAKDPGTLHVFARLKPGIQLRTAEAAARTALARTQAGQDPKRQRTVTVETLREAYTGWNWRPLIFFLGAATFVLLLGCANVANLLLARALRRQREFAIRGALGGGRGSLVRLLLVEGGLLAVIGGAAGLLTSAWVVRALPSFLPPDYLFRAERITLDTRAYLFALTATLVTGLLFGLAPALFAARRDLQAALSQGGRTIGGSRLQRQGRHGLVVVEITIALILVFAAGLFLNSFVRLTRLPLGFDPRGRVTMQVAIGGERYTEQRAIAGFAARLVDKARAVPGVDDAAIGSEIPLRGGSGVNFRVAGQPRPDHGDEPHAIVRSVTPGYHRALGIRRLAGRDFTEHDDESAPAVALINERLGERLFHDGDPIGQRLIILESSGSSWVRRGPVEIVGVVSNIKEVGLNEADFNDISLPLAQHPPSSLTLVAATTLPPRTVIDALRHQIFEMDPNLPVTSVDTMAERVETASRGDRFNLILIGSFAMLAILMAAVGIFGAMSYTMEQRMQEFGVRVALGAPRGTILLLALGQALRLGLAGALIGLGLAIVVARALGTALYMVPAQHEGVIYGVSTTDPLTLGAAGITVMVIAALAGYLPANRATRVDPLEALRAD